MKGQNQYLRGKDTSFLLIKDIKVKVSTQDLDRILEVGTWHRSTHSNTICILKGGKRLMLSRFILGLDSTDKREVLHANGFAFDYTRENLCFGKCHTAKPAPKKGLKNNPVVVSGKSTCMQICNSALGVQVDHQIVDKLRSLSTWGLQRDNVGRVYIRGNVNGKATLLHRYIMKAQPGDKVFFKNGDTLDCRKSNLILRTRTVK